MTIEVAASKTRTVRIEVWTRESQSRSVNALNSHVMIVSGRLYFLQGMLTADEIERLCRELLVDPVTEEYVVDFPHFMVGATHSIDVTLLPGVTDPAAESLLRAARHLGLNGLERAATGLRHFILRAILSQQDLQLLARQVLSNPVIQRFAIDEPISAPFVEVAEWDDTVEIIPIRQADGESLLKISQERRLSLDLHEMIAIRDYYTQLGRDPTDVELEMLAQTWSEHCIHKTFKANIVYTGPAHGASANSPPVEQTIDGILNTYIRAATEKANKPWVRSAFIDNAGIVKFDDQFDLAFKVETHNRPSAIEPFGGANTGVGGVIRDVLGVSARPIANTDVLCFGPPDLPDNSLPQNVLPPHRIAEGVISGIEDYGNKMGIPTVNGAILYHRGYTANPLVFCGCLGMLPHGSHTTDAKPGDYIVVIGGRTGRDGLRGATFSSMEMNPTTSALSGGAVQIGHPIHEKQVLEVIVRARDEGLYNAITDCGAGGLSSAIGEMGEDLGATVQLRSVPLKYPGLRPWEIWLSEAQERMVLAVSPEKWARLQAICEGQDVEAVVVGSFGAGGRLILHYGEKLVCDVSMAFLHGGIPRKHLQAEWAPPQNAAAASKSASSSDLTKTLLSLLAMPTIRSKEDVIRRYDHEVQGGSAVKPLVGTEARGPSDAAVIVPFEVQSIGGSSGAQLRGVAIANGISPYLGEIDPYIMAWAAVDEAFRNAVSVGADPDQVAILDNFCWGNASLPDRLGALVRCAQGCYDAALAYHVPYISGKDSLNNEYLGEDGRRHAIPGTLLISAIGIVPDVNKTVTMDLKAPGNLLYVIGETRAEMRGSHFNLLHNNNGGALPQPVPAALETMRALHRAMQASLIEACHDCSEGGIGVTLAEMCIGGKLGVECYLSALLRTMPDPESSVVPVLFSESFGRFIVEVRRENAAAFENLFADQPITNIGTVRNSGALDISGLYDEQLAYIPISVLEKAWRGDFGVDDALNLPPQEKKRAALPIHRVSSRANKPRVLILHANGTNRDHDAALACQIAGGEPEIVHVNQIFRNERCLLDYHMLVLPGGFSYGDDLGAGVLWALDLRERLGTSLERFISDGRPVLGICNGFQTLVKAGLLPGHDWLGESGHRTITLTYNEKAKFECRWVCLRPNIYSNCLFIRGLVEPLYAPVAHGEGRVVFRSEEGAAQLWADGLVALTYVDANGDPAGYPVNPNGSIYNIAGLCNLQGNVLGLMPHPENHIFPWQHPRFHRGEQGMTGLKLFENGIRSA